MNFKKEYYKKAREIAEIVLSNDSTLSIPNIIYNVIYRYGEELEKIEEKDYNRIADSITFMMVVDKM